MREGIFEMEVFIVFKFTLHNAPPTLVKRGWLSLWNIYAKKLTTLK